MYNSKCLIDLFYFLYSLLLIMNSSISESIDIYLYLSANFMILLICSACINSDHLKIIIFNKQSISIQTRAPYHLGFATTFLIFLIHAPLY